MKFIKKNVLFNQFKFLLNQMNRENENTERISKN